MHFITGGAFNGKRAWVKKQYPTDAAWISAYETAALPAPETYESWCVILEGVEQWVKEAIDPEVSIDILLDKIVKQFEDWLAWEKAVPGRQLVIIGTDISKGIVPVEKAERMQRDVTGWMYQHLVQHAEKADIIWYGIAEKIKDTNKKERF